MFVTSDIFDLRRIGWRLDVDWREHLLCGVDLHGSAWPGVEAVAEFMIAAAKRCGLFEAMQSAGYRQAKEVRNRLITTKSFEKIARGELRGAKGASDLLLRGYREAKGAPWDRVTFGGEASASAQGFIQGREPPGASPLPLRVNFLFPVDRDPFGVSRELLRLATANLGVEYGYVFIRDALCGPQQYPLDSSVPPYFAPLGEVCRCEIDGWWRYATGVIWRERRPKLRDLYQQNLLSARHFEEPVEGLGPLADWIADGRGRGRLESIGAGRMLWSLTDAEMVDVRPILNEAGLLHMCGERVYRDLPGGVAPADRPIPPRIDFRYEDGTKPTYH